MSNGQATSSVSGNWSSPLIWSPAAPTAGQTVTIPAGVTVYVDVTTVMISDLIVNGTLIINSDATSDLNIAGNITINGNSILENNGGIHINTPASSFTILGTGVYIHNPFSNVLSDESIFYNCNESFSTTSTLQIKKWFNGSIPLGDPSRVQTSNFGNLILEANVPGGQWDQDGYFSLPTAARVKGNLTVNSGTIIMDDGSGNTTSLVLQNVTVNNFANIIFQRGSNRNLTLTTGSFNLNSNAPAAPTVILDTSYGILNWTINGNLNLSHDFSAVNSGNYSTGADIRITVNGDLNYSKGNVCLVNKADAPLRLTVTGNANINNTAGLGSLSLIEGGNGALTFSAANFNLQAGSNNYLLGSPTSGQQYKGIGTFTITNDMSLAGSSSLYFAYGDSSLGKIRIAITRDLNIAGNTSVNGAYTNGAFTLRVGRNLTHTQGKFSGQNYMLNTAVDSLIIGTAFIFNSSVPTDFFRANRSAGNTIVTSSTFTVLNSGTASGQGVALVDSGAGNLSFSTTQFTINGGKFTGILSGSGNLTFNCTGALTMSGGIFRGNENTLFSNAGGLSFISGSIEFNGGIFSCYHNSNNSGSVGIVTINGACSINYTNTSDEFTFIGLAATGFDLNNLSLTLSITGAFTISGVTGTFVSSRSLGSETISLSSLTISEGNNSFNSVSGSSTPNGHNVVMTIAGNLTVNGGNTYLSGFSQSFTGILNGNLLITGGSLAVKGGDCTTTTFNILGGYTMTGGEFYLHKSSTDELPASSTITVNINSNDDNNGDFVQSAGTINFDNCLTTPATLNLIINIKSPNYTISGSGIVTMTKPGTGLVFGNLNFARNGLINFNRSGNHSIQQAKQTVQTNCTLDIISGDFQIASNNSISTPPEFLWVNSGAILNAHSAKIYSNALNTNSGITVLGRLKTSHPNGLYNATTNATFSTTLTDNLEFYLTPSSVIEYNGTANQIVTGIGIGRALTFNHKYGILDINFQGTPNINYVYPSNVPNDSCVYIRTNLMLTNGEFNLDDDHNPSNGGGRKISLESPVTTAMQRTAGYIRSEVEDGSAMVKWIMNSTVGAHIFHFGYSSTEYIPFTYHQVSGTSGSVYASTYHTGNPNLPYPPTVTHVRNNLGLDNSSNTVDRFWYINLVNSTTYNATLTFTATPTEIGGITALQAQRWIAPFIAWTNPIPGVQISNANGNTTSGLSSIMNWWTLSGNNSPLPVELLSFTGECYEGDVSLKWSTASETNNDHFSIQRSPDGIVFHEIAIVSGHGTTSTVSDYSYIDKDPLVDISYYRLIQVDYDRKETIYGPIAVQSCKTSHLTASVVSNGNIPKLFIDTKEYKSLQIVVFDTNGKQLSNTSLDARPGFSEYELPMNDPASGIYYVRIQSDVDFVTKKFYIK